MKSKFIFSPEAAVASSSPKTANDEKQLSEKAREEHAYATGIQALVWGRPLIEYNKTIYAGAKAGAAFTNYFRRYENLKTAADRFVVTPNNVTIDAYANANLGIEPLVIFVPSILKERWYILQISDTFDEIVDNLGGYKGQQPGVYLLTGPDYQGAPPLNMKQIKVRTKVAALAVRIFVQGEADLPEAREVQKGFHMMPLSVFQNQGLKYETPKNTPWPQFSGQAPADIGLYEELGFAMKMFLSANENYTNPLVQSFHKIGLSAGKGFAWQTLDELTKRGLARAIPVADQVIDDAYQNSAVIANGWRYSMGGGRGGYDFAIRSAFAKYLLGANVSEQLFYPNTRVDADNQPLSGANKYMLHFSKEEIPPVAVFWNMAMYDEKELFIENDFKRYSIGSTTDGLKINADGSIDLYIQKDDPGADKQSNWLPAPGGSFNLTMRMYGAQTTVLDGSYQLPGVKKVS